MTTNFQLFRFAHASCGLFYTGKFHLWDLCFPFGYLSWKLCQTAAVFPEQAGVQTAVLALAFSLEQRETPGSSTHSADSSPPTWVHFSRISTLAPELRPPILLLFLITSPCQEVSLLVVMREKYLFCLGGWEYIFVKDLSQKY